MKDCPVTCLTSPGFFCLNSHSSRVQSEDSLNSSDQYSRGQGNVCRKDISINKMEEKKQNTELSYNSQKTPKHLRDGSLSFFNICVIRSLHCNRLPHKNSPEGKKRKGSTFSNEFGVFLRSGKVFRHGILIQFN